MRLKIIKLIKIVILKKLPVAANYQEIKKNERNVIVVCIY